MPDTCPHCDSHTEATGPAGKYRLCPSCGWDGSPDPDALDWYVFDGSNIQRDDEHAPDGYSDLHAVADAVRLLADNGDPTLHGARDRDHLIGCCIATLVAVLSSPLQSSPSAHSEAWDFIYRTNF